MEAEEAVNMLDQEEFEKFILFNIGGEISFKKCIENTILLFVFFAIHLIIDVVIGRPNHVFLILFFLPSLFYFISVLKIKKGKTVEGVHYILHDGIFAVCLTFLFGLIGVETLLHSFDGKERGIMICIAGAGYILGSILWGCIIKRRINKKKFSQNKWGKGSVFLCSSSSLLGLNIAKTFFKDMDGGVAMRIMCMLCFILSYLTLIGIVDIFKYQYIVKHPKILNKAKPTHKRR